MTDLPKKLCNFFVDWLNKTNSQHFNFQIPGLSLYFLNYFLFENIRREIFLRNMNGKFYRIYSIQKSNFREQPRKLLFDLIPKPLQKFFLRKSLMGKIFPYFKKENSWKKFRQRPQNSSWSETKLIPLLTFWKKKNIRKENVKRNFIWFFRRKYSRKNDSKSDSGKNPTVFILIFEMPFH